VLAPGAAQAHPHNKARGTFIEVDGVLQPAPAPRFSRTPAALPRAPHTADDGALEQVQRWGIPASGLGALVQRGLVRAGGARAG
jgi:alpha-methylacyl-CoA racemase